MWSDIALGMTRTLGALFSGWLIHRGIDGDTANAIAGSLGALIVAGTSIADKVKRN